MPQTWPLDGPHSPETVLEAAEAAAEAIRYLNYATRPGQGGLKFPQDAARLLGSLETAASRMPQACSQVSSWLAKQAGARMLEDDQGRDPRFVTGQAGMKLETASARAADLGRALGQARSLADSLSVREGGTDER